MYDRESFLKRMMSRPLTPQEFNYDSLSAPPLYSMFTQEDINQLHYIATSAKYSSKIKEKYKMIDKIMNNRGFKKLISGTNRVAYEPVFANNFIVKIAFDSVAINDSIREFHNQKFLKPHCTKVFEVSPCGTIGVFERVNPITSVEEAISLAKNILQLLDDHIIGRYVIDDIGINAYQNYGFRYGFGIVLLDFPYVYEIDPKKLYCNKPNPNNPTGYCNGPIDYDSGFNKLICKWCGAVYKPYELAKKIEYKTTIIQESEERKMKIRISGGSLGKKNEEIITGDFRNPVNSIKSNLLNKKVEKQIKEEEKKVEEKEEVEKTVNGVATPAVEEEKSEDVVDEPVVEEVSNVEESSNKEDHEEKKVVKAFEFFDENEMKSGDPGYINEPSDPNEEVVELLEKINNIYNYSDTSDEDKKDIVKNICSYIKSIIADDIESVIKMITSIFREKKELDDKLIDEFVSSNSSNINNQLVKVILRSGKYYMESEVIDLLKEDDDFIFVLDNQIIKADNGKSVGSFENVKCELTKEFIKPIEDIIRPVEPDENITIEPVEGNIDYDAYVSEEATEFDIVDGYIINKKDLFNDAEPGKVVVIRNDDGKYLTINGKIIGINNIDHRGIKDVAIVPKEWYKDAMKRLEPIKQAAPVGALPITDQVEESTSDDVEEPEEE